MISVQKDWTIMAKDEDGESLRQEPVFVCIDLFSHPDRMNNRIEDISYSQFSSLTIILRSGALYSTIPYSWLRLSYVDKLFPSALDDAMFKTQVLKRKARGIW